ncbi:MAG: sugar-binding domain-containing protein [Armatimonadota bacterium]
MTNYISLDGNWKIRGFDGQHGFPQNFIKEDCDETVFYPAIVPGEIHLDLEREGIIDDLNFADNAQKARWVEEQVWVYRKKFEAPSEALNKPCWIVFEGLDLDAQIYLNGELIGTHCNAYIPCRINITEKLKQGENTLAVMLDGGLYYVSDKNGKDYNPNFDHPLHKRAWLRKPQYQFSWDWNPRLINVGIFRPVKIEWAENARIDSKCIYSILSEDLSNAKLNINLNIENVQHYHIEADIVISIPQAGIEHIKLISLKPGMANYNIEIDIDNPKLWWPREYGEQNLYDISAKLIIKGNIEDSFSARTGFRKIEIDKSPHPEKGEYFIIKVNNEPIFCKGGNWVPADMIYSKVTPEHYRKLVELAYDAEFNFLRIWGGGLYADHSFLERCDELGILVWHDFLFACSKYPTDNPEYLNLVRNEIRFAVRDLSEYPSLAIWCGNNELEWAAWCWSYDKEKPHPDYALYHMEIPRILLSEDPSRPYWPSSPYSENHRDPNDPTTGDQHPWGVSIGEHKSNFWAYRDDISRFPNEGGVLGASLPTTVNQFLPESQRKLFSPSWEFHDNLMNYMHEPQGACYDMIERWLGKNPRDMSFEDYLFYSAVMQSEGLREYINNFRRRKYDSSSAVFWMYNDSWPVSHGWTIVDYYLRKKLSYHPVRNAFKNIRAIAALDGDNVSFYAVNDTLKPWIGQIRYGIFNLAGGFPEDRQDNIEIPANCSIKIGEISLDKWYAIGYESSAAFVLLIKDGKIISQERLFNAPHKDLKFSETCVDVRKHDDCVVFESPVFVWCVCIDNTGEAHFEDNCFDLLPGIPYELRMGDNAKLPKVIRTASPIKA